MPLYNPDPVAITINFTGGDAVMSTGIVYSADLTVPCDMVITSWQLTADLSGDLVVDIWNADFASYPPTVSNTITGSEKPTITGGIANNDLSLTTWTTTTILAGTMLRFKIDTVTAAKNATLSLIGVRG